MSNINTVIQLDDNSAFNLIRACENGQLMDPISATSKRIIHISEAIKLNVIIRERDGGDFGEIVGVSPGHSQELHLTKAKMFDVGCNPYQLKENAVVVLNLQPIYGDVFCEHKKVQIGENVCKSPVYKLTGSGGILDTIAFESSTERLKMEGFLKTNSSLKKALHFEFPQTTPVGKFFKSPSIDDKAVLLRFTYQELLEGGIKFQALPNVSIQTTSEDININVFAPMFMAPQQVPIKIVITSGQYNIQNNILLSDFVDESSSGHSQSESPSSPPTFREPEILKIWFATAIGVVCGIVCIFVTIAYFLLRRWRSKQRIQTQFFPHQIRHIDSVPPKSAHGLQPEGQDGDHLSSSVMPVPLSASGSLKAVPDQDTSWGRQKSRWNAASPALCFFHAGTAVQVGDECGQSSLCTYSKAIVTSRPPS
ncbi:hypothetical protein TSMEX_002647 [Taenia solium]|eukprot:TsM_001114800 transcript=TsM_001114800 gene=TsM_001114800